MTRSMEHCNLKLLRTSKGAALACGIFYRLSGKAAAHDFNQSSMQGVSKKSLDWDLPTLLLFYSRRTKNEEKKKIFLSLSLSLSLRVCFSFCVFCSFFRKKQYFFFSPARPAPPPAGRALCLWLVGVCVVFIFRVSVLCVVVLLSFLLLCCGCCWRRRIIQASYRAVLYHFCNLQT